MDTDTILKIADGLIMGAVALVAFLAGVLVGWAFF